jgi:hypothetical protein
MNIPPKLLDAEQVAGLVGGNENITRWKLSRF